jgi:hypothetical protein
MNSTPRSVIRAGVALAGLGFLDQRFPIGRQLRLHDPPEIAQGHVAQAGHRGGCIFATLIPATQLLGFALARIERRIGALVRWNHEDDLLQDVFGGRGLVIATLEHFRHKVLSRHGFTASAFEGLDDTWPAHLHPNEVLEVLRRYACLIKNLVELLDRKIIGFAEARI